MCYNSTISAVMILAAGFGSRLRPLTDNTPKPLVSVCGRPMIEHTFDSINMECEQFSRVVINTHYLSSKMDEYLSFKHDDRILISHEKVTIMNTGGGVKQALSKIAAPRFFTRNPDALWKGQCPFCFLRKHWREDDMDSLMLMIPYENTFGFAGIGDLSMKHADVSSREAFCLDALGCIDKDEYSLVYGGMQIVRSSCFSQIESDIFPMSSVWSMAKSKNRLYAAVYEGDWFDIGTLKGIQTAEQHLLHNEQAVS